MRLVTAAQMRVLEAAAVAAGSSPAQLMEEAGLAVAQEAWMLLGTLEGRSIVVLVGPGNNGGDGIVAARHLASWGAGVIVFLPLPRPAADPLLAGLEGAGVNLMPPGGDGDALARALTGADLVVDALLGIGQSRAIDPAGPMGLALASVAEARRGYQPPKLIAVDLPSGMQADTGALDPLTVAADLTVTFGLPKVGMYQGASGEALGRVQVIDIGIPRAAQDAVTLELLTSRWARETLPPRPAGGNKGTFGRVLIVGGSMRYPGAPRLAALGAYRAGAGLVTIGCPRAVLPQLAPGLAEATWLPLPGGEDGALCGEAALALRDEWHAFDAAAIGPGVGDTEETRALTWAILPDIAASLPNGVVIDADALNAIAAMPDGAGRLPPHAVLTPHPGELS
ncbi:MAG: NAD(P)H-hydrate epimerase, partial [Tepidiformaceae bacterium]